MNNPELLDNLQDLIKGVGDKEVDLAAKKRAIEEYRIERSFSQIEESKKELEAIQSLNFDIRNNQSIVAGIKAGREYMDSASKCLRFINDDFNGKVPFFSKNIVLIGAYSGDGKSTITGNACFDLVCQGKKVLVITNEETLSDVYNRVSCLAKGWLYANHENFTEEQKDILDRSAIALADRMYVIDNNHEGADNLTTSYEGVVSILSSIEKQGTLYDAIIIDYYQNISIMKADPKMDAWKVQAKFAKYIDQFKNRYPAPILVLAQLKPISKENPLPFKERIEGTKAIYNVATFAMEVRAEKTNMKTEWTVHKSRFNDCNGQVFHTGWSKGKYVKYDQQFIEKVNKMKADKTLDKIRVTLGAKTNE